MKSQIELLSHLFRDRGRIVQTQSWQSQNIKDIPGSKMVELLHPTFHAPMGSIDLDPYRESIKPNLPWADDHFAERVCGEPLNPGKEWENWPWGNKAQESLDKNGQFNHNYMERYWPKFAGMTKEGRIHNIPYDFDDHATPIKGIRHEYGDLKDLINLLAFDPTTRQAYMPIWFPEDTGTTHDGRKPCTLGYQFIMRNGQLDITYYIRSCDFYRHFRDDVYMTIRLALYVLESCKQLNPDAWRDVIPGDFRMHITSLHVFINDYITLYGRQPHG